MDPRYLEGHDLDDRDWSILEPLLPCPSRTGRKRGWPMCGVINANFYLLHGSSPWRMLLKHFPPHQATYAWFALVRDDGTWRGVNHHLLMLDQERVGREATLSVGVMDKQGVKITEAGRPRGYDAAKKTNGRKQATTLGDIDHRAVCCKSASPMPRVATAPYRCGEHHAPGPLR